MKPSFALVLTQDIIGLLHRTSQGWQAVGQVEVTDPELPEALAVLRTSAIALDPNGITTKLVIPNSEILYTTVHAPGPSAAARRSQIKAALEGRTPYAVGDLVFDWSGKGAEVRVAVVARETLEEAEAFAVQHRLGPLSFVGSAEAGMFEGEPWFGPSAAAADLLRPGEKVERDQSPVPLPARPVPQPEPEPEPRPAVAVVADTPPEVVGDIARGSDEAPPSGSATVASPLSQDASLPAPPPVEVAPVVPEPVELPASPAPGIAATGAEALTTPVIEPVAAAVPPPATVQTPAPARAATPSPAIDDPLPPPLARLPRADVIAQTLEVPPEEEDDLPATAGVGVPAPAVERLKARLAEQPVDQRRFGTQAPGPGAAPPPLGPAAAGARPGAAASARALKPVPGQGAAVRPASAGARPAPPARIAAKGALRGGGVMVTSPSIPLPRDRRVNIPTADAAAEARARAGGATAGAEARKSTRAEGEGLTSFGGKQVRRGKPKYLGLILTGVLLVALAAVAAWSTYFLASDDASGPAPAVSAPAPASPAATEQATVAQPASADTATAAPETAAPDPGTEADGGPALADGTPDTVSDPVPGMTVAPPPSPFAEAAEVPATAPVSAETGATATVATLGAISGATSGAAVAPEAAAPEAAVIAQPDAATGVGRNPVLEPQDEIFLARTDPGVSIADLVALAPPAAATDPVPAPQALPPPFGTVYQFDAEGLIVPTPEGIVTPEGVRLVAGRPPLVPPARPADAAPEAAAPAAAGAEPVQPAAPVANDAAGASVAGVVTQPPADPVEAEPAVASDPALAGARPRSRPADLTPVSDDDAALPPADDTRTTSLRPRERPTALLAEAAPEAQAAEETAAVQAAAASLAAVEPAGAQTSPLAIAVSRRPAARPADLSRAVKAAAASVAPAPQVQPEEPVAVAAAPAPEPEPRRRAAASAIAQPEPAAKPRQDPAEDEIDEPEAASVAPDVPTRANVARQATFRNAINLSRVNLIGVYGSASNRYALVRQPNGRYVKVEVGDRVDGGRVAAISDRELKYVKNGRTVTLSMPRS